MASSYEVESASPAGLECGSVSDTFQKIRKLVADGAVRISEHGYDELAADGIPVRDVVAGINQATVVED